MYFQLARRIDSDVMRRLGSKDMAASVSWLFLHFGNMLKLSSAASRGSSATSDRRDGCHDIGQTRQLIARCTGFDTTWPTDNHGYTMTTFPSIAFYSAPRFAPS